MKNVAILAILATTLAGCGTASGNYSPVLANGNDISFVTRGSTSCPGVAESNNPIYDRYPLRCGPQAQSIPH